MRLSTEFLSGKATDTNENYMKITTLLTLTLSLAHTLTSEIT